MSEPTACLPLVKWHGRQQGPFDLPTGHPRILLGPYVHFEHEPGEWLRRLGGRERVLAACGPQDIVWVPLHRSSTNTVVWTWEGNEIPDYDEHVALIREIAPRVAGIKCGNMGPEFCGQMGAGAEFMFKEAAEFVKRSADLIRGAGGRPVYGTVDWSLLMDCEVGGPLRNVMLDVEALQICYCGFCLHPNAHWDRDNPLWGGQLVFQRMAWGDVPAPELVDYIRGAPVWSGANGTAGLEAGNDRALAELGFAAACYDPGV